ncbi:MAG: peptidylprolyl isomerase [Pseudomonadota bacterium]
MGKTAAVIALMAATPAVATGIDITVTGEANGVISVDLFEDVAPGHVERITTLAEAGQYNGVVFHRVIEGFMAQTGDVQFGNATKDDYNYRFAGRGGSDLPDLSAEFSEIPFDKGVLGMARSPDPDSANSQFFIMFEPGYFLNGQYTVVGKVTAGQDVVDGIKRGHPRTGSMTKGEPDRMLTVTVTE